MNNKTDGQNTASSEGLRSRGRSGARNGEKKHRASFLLVDLLLLIGVVAVILLLILAFTPLTLFGGDTVPQQIVYTVEFYAVDKEMEHVFREGDVVVDVQTGAQMGVVLQTSGRPYVTYIDIPSADIDPELGKHEVQTVENEAWRIVTVSILVTADYESGVGYTVDAQRIAVGREYQLRFPGYTDTGACVSVRAANDGEVGA